jgi:hypothetical protein
MTRFKRLTGDGDIDPVGVGCEIELGLHRPQAQKQPSKKEQQFSYHTTMDELNNSRTTLMNKGFRVWTCHLHHAL